MKEKILKHLKQSKTSIIIAVSWLTDKDIIEVILQKRKEGVPIKILLSASEWNMMRYYEFKNLKDNGVLIQKRGAKESGKGKFMHCKFAVIDEKILLHGSYNWTKSASTNDENLDVTDDYSKAREYVLQFQKLYRDSIDFFEDIDETGLDKIIEKYETMENENLEPSDGNDPTGNNGGLVKVEEPELPSVIPPASIINFEDLFKYDFDNIQRIEFEGRLYISSFSFGDPSSNIKVSSNHTNSIISMNIENLWLDLALIQDNREFSILKSKLSIIPDFICKLLLQKRFVNLRAGIGFLNGKPYKFIEPSVGHLSLILEEHDENDKLDNYISHGYKLLNEINFGEKSLEDIRREFQGMKWLSGSL